MTTQRGGATFSSTGGAFGKADEAPVGGSVGSEILFGDEIVVFAFKVANRKRFWRAQPDLPCGPHGGPFG